MASTRIRSKKVRFCTVTRFLSIICAIVCSATAVLAGGDDVHVMRRVDTAHPQVRRVLNQWVDSLAQWSIPTSWYGMHLVRPTTQSVVRDWFYHESARPTVLSVDFDGNSYAVRTLFTTRVAGSSTEQPLGTLRCRFTLDASGSSWIIEDALETTTRHWDTTRIGIVTLIHAPIHIVDSQEVEASVELLRQTAERFSLATPSHVQCYVVDSRDDICQMLGIDYYAYPPSGISYPRDGIVLQSNDASLRHELMHILFSQYAQTHPVLREGIATLLGGTGVLDVDQAVDQYIRERDDQSTPSFVQLFTSSRVEQADVYVLGAVLCDAVLRSGGSVALFEVLQLSRPSDVMYRIASVLDLDISDRQESMYSFVVRQSRRTLQHR